ncbi:MAG: porphobilinogen synthase [Bordetella sp.]|nr:MAG: porphobilinogen synthase [Bordetella sp.]
MLITPEFPMTRLRRLRRDNYMRRLIQENILTVNDLIYPVFVMEGQHQKEAIPSMPGIFRYTIDTLIPVAEECLNLGIPILALFPVINESLKDASGIESLNPDGLIPKTIGKLKRTFPELGILTDVALDPYTIHGQDGIIDKNGYVLNDESIEILVKQALIQAEAGTDIIAPSDMMDGRIKLIRKELEDKKYINTQIMAYSAKYASAFYSPFREAVKSLSHLKKSDKKTYQLNPGNINEAIREIAADITEGSDMIMIKPGMPYLDVLSYVKNTFHMPTFIYQVSGEYSMIKAASLNGWLDGDKIMMETLLGFKRAGANGIFTYFALEAAKLLKDSFEF